MKRDRCLGKALLLTALTLAGPSCSDPTSAGPPVCPQPGGEFGAYSCAVLDVQVLGSDGQPLRDVTVGFHALRECGCNEFGTEVDDDGRFHHTTHRFDPPDSTGDTITVRVYAAATGRQYPQPTDSTFIADTAHAVLHFRPIGAPSVATSLELRLPLP